MWIISFWLFPVIASMMWLAMLLTMLIRWKVDGSPRYSSMEEGQRLAYISDVGAAGLKPLFITGCAITMVFFNLSFLSERWLRHKGKLLRNKGRTDKALAIVSIIFAFCGGIGLLMLSIFDTVGFPKAHNGCLALFIVGYLLSAVFVCAEYGRLGIYYRDHRILAASFWVKLIFIIVEFSLAVAFAASGRRHRNAAAVLEWVVAFIFTFYIFSFIIDLLPSVRTRNHIPQGERLVPEMTRVNMPPPTAQEGVAYEQPLTTDSMGDTADTYRGHVADRPPLAAFTNIFSRRPRRVKKEEATPPV
ncbi:hypothetical protein AJ80_05772 [Polytolypa hystricis UAMH7299]|uniref:CWH43-like N-terminal domain-containing protein n=1 Tax=Polytolypa hystricis (strain UAMH7299) TaxID=1447883 RepID=A0A2B7Y047_POLH7|nr:hypothetical protein AJ80_05772 [Polytolypa hystricis UAMH7299]